MTKAEIIFAVNEIMSVQDCIELRRSLESAIPDDPADRKEGVSRFQLQS
jgi:hypothetical protein